MTMSSVATAPGKAILFGEHAVVYGTTAVAASLSDLRIKVETSTCAGGLLEVTFDDIAGLDGLKPAVIAVPLQNIQQAVAQHEDPYQPVHPDITITEILNAMFAPEIGSGSVRSGMISVVYLVGKILSQYVWGTPNDEQPQAEKGLKIRILSMGLPIGAGLGSSASFSVAVAASCLRLSGMLYPSIHASNAGLLAPLQSANIGDSVLPGSVALDAINGWAFCSEILLHGSPSGLDNTTSCYGGLVRFSREGGESFQNIHGAPALHILLVNTKVPRSTKELVAGVRRLRDRFPNAVNPILQAMNGIATTFLDHVDRVKGHELSNGIAAYDELVKETGDLMRLNHSLLNAIGVGHAALDAVVGAAADKGFACKLTGAGGGGCAVVLSAEPYAEGQGDHAGSNAQKGLASLVQTLQSMGYDVHSSSVGGPGVQWVA